MQKQKEKSEKVKAILKKSLDVFCYIVTALAVTLAIAMGVNSCSGSNEPQRIDPQQVETSKALRGNLTNPDYDEYFVYENRYAVGTYTIDLDYIRSIFDVPATNSAVARQDIYRNVVFISPAYVLSDSATYVPITRLAFNFKDYQINSSTNQFEYKVRYVKYAGTDEISSGGGNTANILFRNSVYSQDDVYVSSPCRIVISDSDLTDNDGAMSVLAPAYSQDFTFNASFNYNAPFGLPYNSVYSPSSITWSGGGDVMKYVDYDVGWFSSNGRLFNSIQWWALQGDGVAVVISDRATQLPAGDNWVYVFMYYVNTWTTEKVLVNSRDSLPYNDGNSRYYANSSTWQVPAYRKIRLLQTPTQDTIDLLGSFNNNNVYDTGGLSAGGNFTDVFTLVGSAFTGILPILTLQILPSVTIGTLLFVPLVAILVFAIIRIIKK